MKRNILLLIAAVMVFGSMSAQNHYQMTVGYQNNMRMKARVYIDGVLQESANVIEIGVFNGSDGNVTDSKFVRKFGSYGYQVNLTIGGNGSASYPLVFKLYDHANEVEVLNYTVTDNSGNVCDNLMWGPDAEYGSYNAPYSLYFTTATTQTFERTIAGYGTNDGGYVLVSSPIGNVAPANVENMIYTAADEVQFYDLYAFDQDEDLEWRNFKAGGFTELEYGKGYLYANRNTVTLRFTGTPYAGDGKVTLKKTAGAEFEGWNLVGNPFPVKAYIDRPFYVMNSNGSGIMAESQTGEILAMNGVFVIAASDNEEMQFTTTAPSTKSSIVLNVSDSRGNIIDRAIVNFGEGRQLPKFQLNENSTKVFFEQEGRDFAVVSSEAEGSMPVYFKAEENSRYTLDFKAENMDFAYLHLIDNETGEDIDLIENPTYNFAALTTDPVSRFKIVYAKTTTGVNENFAFISDGQIILNGVDNGANVQVIDALGRIIANGNGIQTVSTKGLSAGVYVIRLINGNKVHTQKIVVE